MHISWFCQSFHFFHSKHLYVYFEHISIVVSSRFQESSFVLFIWVQVETIGDAYMVVGGLPIPVPSHADRIANMALGMTVACQEVMSPVTREPIKVSWTVLQYSCKKVHHSMYSAAPEVSCLIFTYRLVILISRFSKSTRRDKKYPLRSGVTLYSTCI